MPFRPPFVALHIPDGFLSLPVATAGLLAAAVLVAAALLETRRRSGDERVPLLGVLAAFVFAAQMINFPVLGGTSGHLLGGTLVALLLGPWAGALVMVCVVAVQALLFQDGGLLALGANTLNMAFLSTFAGFGAYAALTRVSGGRGRLLTAGLGAWLATLAASTATALQLAASGTAPLGVTLGAMTAVHVVIGVGEALITVGALAFIARVRPDVWPGLSPAADRRAALLSGGLLVALLVALAAPLASPLPDGLERVAEEAGFASRAEPPSYEVLPDYTIPGINAGAASTIAAGLAGIGAAALIGMGAARLVRRRASE